MSGLPYTGATFVLDGTGSLGCLSGKIAGTAVVTILGAPTGFGGNCISHPLTRLGGAGLGVILRV